MLNHSSPYAELTDEHFRAIGRLVVEWSNAEYLLAVVLGRLLFLPESVSRVYSGRMSAAVIEDAIDEAIKMHKSRYACRLVPEALLDEIKKTTECVRHLRSLRNKFAHFCWMRNTDDAIFGTNFRWDGPRRDRPAKGVLTLRISELDGLYDEAYSVAEKLLGIVERLPQFDEEDMLHRLGGGRDQTPG